MAQPNPALLRLWGPRRPDATFIASLSCFATKAQGTPSMACPLAGAMVHRTIA